MSTIAVAHRFRSAISRIPSRTFVAAPTMNSKLWELGILNHVAIACHDLDKATAFYRDVLKGKCSEKIALPEHGVTTVFVNLGNTKIELLHPLGDKSPISGFLAKNKDGGMHHICLEVDNVFSAMSAMRDGGVRVLDKEPKVGAHGKLVYKVICGTTCQPCMMPGHPEKPHARASTSQSVPRLGRLLLLGVVFHVVYSWSIFDIYFRSPLVHGMSPVQPPGPAPAKRLVLFVADGLRADKLFEDGMARAPFLRDVVMNQGSWGISRTRVPTESRPGHVALIAGFYEDVSAVMHGWKTNPVEFDSLFNESRKTWSFGSPDILPMFALGASDPNRVETFMYPPEFEDFAEEDASKLDSWVFEKVDAFFENAKSNSTMMELLHADKIVFFLQFVCRNVTRPANRFRSLLGIDTNGHAHRPNSKEYLSNIELVDKGISIFVRKFNEFYENDGKTSFVFSADHGMSNRGNHGDGHPDNTETPLIAWGAGVAKPKKAPFLETIDEQDNDGRRLNNISLPLRHDVNQADVAPLMSTLIGVPFPMNSVGQLPLDFIENTDLYKAQAAFQNAIQILKQFIVKEESKRRTELYFAPFKHLRNRDGLVSEIQSLIDTNLIDLAEEKSVDLAKLCIEGLRYYQTYDWLFLRGMISVGYLGWILNSLLFVLKTYGAHSSDSESAVSPEDSKLVSYIGLSAFVLFSIVMYLKESPPNYYLYVAFLAYLWAEAFKQRNFALNLIRRNLTSRELMTNIAKLFGYIISLEILVFSYFRREILTPALIVAGIVWPQMTPDEFRAKNYKIVWFWRISCVVTSIFTMLPVEYAEDMRLVTAGGVLVFISGIYAAHILPKFVMASLPVKGKLKSTNEVTPKIILVQLALIACSLLIVNDTSMRLKRKEGLPLLNQVASWIILVSCGVIPALDMVKEGHYFLRRLVVVYLSFAPLFILLSVSYETLFYFSFSQTLLGWLLMERQLYSDLKGKEPIGNDYRDIAKRKTRQSSRARKESEKSTENFRLLTTDDLRIASIFLLLINVAFFGTGNIASVSSFSIQSVYRFITLFDPVIMGILLIIKLLVPFFLLSAVFGVISRSISLPAFSLFLLVLSTTDVMTLNFFFLVRDSGSWLEIGTTISHFIIASTFIVFQIVLFTVGHSLVGKILIPDLRNGKSD
ncbi:Glycosyl phosphatidyl inositol anchor synthesis [Entophlyctis luteolus]|nr:Glycosyl phosphatidyl inositol anchor synthesis [Entophlyctis luteolus]